MKRIPFIFALVVLLPVSLMAEKIKVVTTFLPIYAHTKSIAGDLADVRSLVESGAEPHHFQFKPSDMKKLKEANLIIINGLGIEDWLNKALENFTKDHKAIIDTSEGVDLLENPEVIELTAERQGDSHKHSETEKGKNPHIWLDPVSAQIQVRNILKGLQKVDPINAKAYQTNAEIYLNELGKLNQDFKNQIEVLKNKNLITFHDAFPYLAKRYGFKYIACVEDFPEKSPSPQVIKSVVDLIRKNQVTTVFVEEGYSQRALQAIAKESGAKIATLDTIEVGVSEADAYLKRMRSNLETLKLAWK